jgi:hypothetical protein
MKRGLWKSLGGLDEHFAEPGGGLINHDVFRRALESPDTELVLLLGEGTFHQFHHGIATNAPAEQAGDNWARWVQQYEAICGRPYAWPRLKSAPAYIGKLPRPVLARLARAAINPFPREIVEPASPDSAPVEPPLGLNFDQELWSLAPPVQSFDASIAALIDLMHEKFRAGHCAAAVGVARLIREKAPDEQEPQRLLSLLAAWPPQPWDAEYQLALAEAQRLLKHIAAGL